MSAENILIKLKKIPRCAHCSADDNLVSDQEYVLYAETMFISRGSRLWLWNKSGDVGYFTEEIIKRSYGKFLSRNAKYLFTYG